MYNLLEGTIAEDSEKPLKIVRPEHKGARITVHMEPAGDRLSLPRPKTVRQLLDALNLLEETALVAREGKLLTPDRHIWPEDEVLVRIVISCG